MPSCRVIIYSIYCIPEDKFYIGQTSASLKRRMSQHYRAGKYYGDEATLIDRTLQQYPKSDFIIQEIEQCTMDNRNDREIYWIDYYESMYPNGYNCAPGGRVNRCNFTDDELDDIAKLYASGQSLAQIAQVYSVSTDTVRKYLEQMDIAIRSLQEQQQFNNTHQFYRMDCNHIVLQSYNSYSEIGQWLIDNNLTTSQNPARAGVAIRYAILFEHEAYGFLWDTDFWSEDEKVATREQLIQQNRARKSANKNRIKKRIRPNRTELISGLQQYGLSQMAQSYNVQQETVRKWCRYFFVSTSGEDLSTPEQEVPEEYVIKRKALSPTEKKATYKRQSTRSDRCPENMEQLLYEIAYSSVSEVAYRYHVSTKTIFRWCKQHNLPHQVEDIRQYICEKYDILPENLTHNPSSVKRNTSDESNNRYPADIDELLCEIAATSFSAVGRKYGVNGNAIIKWCRNHNRPWHIKEVRQYVQEHNLLQ